MSNSNPGDEAMAAVEQPIVELRHLSKRFGSIVALSDASLALRPGQVTALVGDNGAGKSTLVKCLSGVLHPDSGELLVDGRPLEMRDPHLVRQLGVHTVFQDLALVESLSTVENMFLGAECRLTVAGRRLPWLDRRTMRREASRAVTSLGITTLSDINARIESLSGGQRQSVAIARAVHAQARVLVLDEPTAALGVTQAAQVLALIERLRASRTAVLIISHNLREVFAVADVITVLRLGEVAAEFQVPETTEEEVVSAIVGANGAVAALGSAG